MRSKKLRLAALAMTLAMVTTSVPSSVLAADFTSDFDSEEISFDVIDDFSGGELVAEAPAEEDFFAGEAVVEDDVNLVEVAAEEMGNIRIGKVYVINANEKTFTDEYTDPDTKEKTTEVVNVEELDAYKQAEPIVIGEKNYGKLILAYNEQSATGDTVYKAKFIALTANDIIPGAAANCVHGEYFDVRYQFPGESAYWLASSKGEYLTRIGTKALGHDFTQGTPEPRYITHGDCVNGVQAEIFMDIRCVRDDAWFSEELPAEAAKTELGKDFPQKVGYEHVKNDAVETVTKYHPTKEYAVGTKEAETEGLTTVKPSAYPYYKYTMATCIYGHVYVEEVQKVLRPAEGYEYKIDNTVNIQNADELKAAGIKDQTAADPVANMTNDKILLENCAVNGSYGIYRTSSEWVEKKNDDGTTTEVQVDEMHLVKTVTIEAPHHIIGKAIIKITVDGKGKKLAEAEETEITADEMAKKDLDAADFTNKSEYVVFYRKDNVLHVVSKDCNTIPYEMTTYCANPYTWVKGEKKTQLHKIGTENLVSETGAHLFDTDAEKRVKDLVATGDVTLEKLQKEVNKDKNGNPLKDKDGKPMENQLVKVVVGYEKGVSLWDGAATCDTPGTVKLVYICGANEAHTKVVYIAVAALGHDETAEYKVTENVPATCTKDGYFVSSKTCPRCGKVIDTKKYPLKALGHTYERKGYVAKPAKYVLGLEGTYIVDTAYTGNKGSLELKFEENPKQDVGTLLAIVQNRHVDVVLQDVCTDCGAKKKVDNTTGVKVVVDKFEKSGQYCEEKTITFTATYTLNEKEIDKQTYSVPYYSDTYDYFARTNHEPGEPVQENVVPATETTEGSYDSVVYCKICGLEIARRPMTTPVTGHVHKMNKVEAKEETCEEDGNIEYYTCEGCGNFYADEAGEKQIAQEDTVVKAGHKLTKVEAKEATTTEEGNIEYFVCERCGKIFKEEADGEETKLVEITEEETKTPKKVELPAKVTGVKTKMYPSSAYPSKGYAEVAWDVVEGADNYRVSVRLLGTSEWTKIETNSAATSYRIQEPLITVGASYEIRVAAGKEGVFGPRSDVIRRYYESVTPVFQKTSESITVSWDAVEKGSSYMVIYSENKSMKPYKTVIVRNGITTAVLKNLKAGTRYYIRVRPYDKTGKTATGALSPLKSVVTKK